MNLAAAILFLVLRFQTIDAPSNVTEPDFTDDGATCAEICEAIGRETRDGLKQDPRQSADASPETCECVCRDCDWT